MIKVGLVTNWQEACAVAEYANNLVMHAEDRIKFQIITRPLEYAQVVSQARDVDLIHFNYADWVFRHWTPQNWRGFKARIKKPVMMTIHESNREVMWYYGGVGDEILDVAVAHENLNDEEHQPKGYRHIPQPIRMVEGLSPARPKYKIGVHGFPFSWKRFREAAHVAVKLNLGFMALLSKPKSDPVNLDQIANDLMDVHPSAEIEIGWLPYDYMVRRLRECVATIYPYDEDAKLFGVSAGVRMGMAAQRPIIVSSHHQQFRDLESYEDEIYRMNSQSIESMEQAVQAVLQDTNGRCERKPTRLLTDMSWNACATKYVEIYQKLVQNAEESHAA